jgi:hypothetical protein
MKIKLPFTGGCSCGAIRYESAAEPIMMFKCHCRDCQHATGGAFAPGMLLPRETFRFTRGQLRYHFTASLKGGKHKRGFCPECGSRVTGGEFEAGDSPFIGVLAGPWTIRAGFSLKWTFSFRTLNPGTKWILQFQSSNNTHRHQQRNNWYAKNNPISLV